MKTTKVVYTDIVRRYLLYKLVYFLNYIIIIVSYMQLLMF